MWGLWSWQWWLWCLSTNPWVCDITFQKTTVFIVIYVQRLSGSLPLKTKVNWKNEANYSVLFIFQVWAIIMTFIIQSKQHSYLKYHTRKKWKIWQFYLKHYNRNIFTDLYNIRFIKLINSHERHKHWSEHQVALHFFIWFCRYELKICVFSSIVICQ